MLRKHCNSWVEKTEAYIVIRLFFVLHFLLFLGLNNSLGSFCTTCRAAATTTPPLEDILANFPRLDANNSVLSLPLPSNRRSSSLLSSQSAPIEPRIPSISSAKGAVFSPKIGNKYAASPSFLLSLEGFGFLTLTQTPIREIVEQ